MGNAPDKPLNRVTVLVTRSRHQSGELSEKLRAVGAGIVELPVIEIGPPATWQPLDQSLKDLERYDWIVFASVNAVVAVSNRLQALGAGPSDLSACRLAAVGPSTAGALRELSLSVDFCPDRYIAEGLVEGFPGYPALSGTRVLWPRSNVGRTYIADRLREAGAVVDTPECYRSELPGDADALADELVRRLRNREIDVVTLASSQTARNFASLLSRGLKRCATPETLTAALAPVLVACIGPETAASARDVLGRADVEAVDYTVDGLVRAIGEHLARDGRPEQPGLD